MEDDVLKLKEVVSVTFDTTPFYFKTPDFPCRPILSTGDSLDAISNISQL